MSFSSRWEERAWENDLSRSNVLAPNSTLAGTAGNQMFSGIIKRRQDPFVMFYRPNVPKIWSTSLFLTSVTRHTHHQPRRLCSILVCMLLIWIRSISLLHSTDLTDGTPATNATYFWLGISLGKVLYGMKTSSLLAFQNSCTGVQLRLVIKVLSILLNVVPCHEHSRNQ